MPASLPRGCAQLGTVLGPAWRGRIQEHSQGPAFPGSAHSVREHQRHPQLVWDTQNLHWGQSAPEGDSATLSSFRPHNSPGGKGGANPVTSLSLMSRLRRERVGQRGGRLRACGVGGGGCGGTEGPLPGIRPIDSFGGTPSPGTPGDRVGGGGENRGLIQTLSRKPMGSQAPSTVDLRPAWRFVFGRN